MLELLKVILWVLFTLAVGLVSGYKGELEKRSATLIAKAEENFKDTTESGGDKFNWVVDKLYLGVPAPLKLFFTKAMLGTLVQSLFDSMKKYATQQIGSVIFKE